MKSIYLLFFFTSNIFATPDFLIIGATKCGTTSLYDYLTKHPKIIGANKKELKFFCRDQAFKQGIKYYKSLFPVKKNNSELIGEATPGYFWKKNCAERIAKFCPKTKLILMLRNPTKRAISHYFFVENTKYIRNTHRKYATFEEAITNTKPHEAIIGIGRYLDHINHWLKFFPRKQILIVILEDLIAHPEQEVNKVFNFLGLKNYKLNSYEIIGKGSYKNGSINPTTINWLNDFYKPYNKQLEKFLGRDLPWNS